MWASGGSTIRPPIDRSPRGGVADLHRKHPDRSKRFRLFEGNLRQLDQLQQGQENADQSATGEVEILVGPRHLFFRFGDRLYTSRVLDGEFPKYERVIPRSNETFLVLERAALIDVLKRVQLTSNDMNAVMFTTSINGNGMALNVSAQSAEIGSAEESLPVVYDGAQVTFQMSSTFILDFLQVASEPQITIAMKDAKSPFLFIDGHVNDAKDQTHFGVIVPMG